MQDQENKEINDINNFGNDWGLFVDIESNYDIIFNNGELNKNNFKLNKHLNQSNKIISQSNKIISQFNKIISQTSNIYCNNKFYETIADEYDYYKKN